LTQDRPEFLRLDNMNSTHVPIRIGILLPFSNGSAATRALAASMMKAAELALFDANNPDIVLIPADEGTKPESSEAAAESVLAQGAEIILGPLFSQATQSVARVARDHGVPVISFSTDRDVAGNGVYLLSFQPAVEVQRVISYAASQGHTNFAALVPETVYGERAGNYFLHDVKAAGGRITNLEKFVPEASALSAPLNAVEQAKPDAIFIAEGGSVLRNIVTDLGSAGANMTNVKLLGTGLWDDPSIAHEPLLAGAWFAAPPPEIDRDFVDRYHSVYGASPLQPQLDALAYDAVSLVAYLASGTPYKRFTQQALTDPDGFTGVNGIFRFHSDGTIERGLAVLSIQPGGGFRIVSPAPKTFQPSGS
jgi:ABC-type branched-subunit amino acid transport system substrate-binding protein